jgi:hypothetical protein
MQGVNEGNSDNHRLYWAYTAPEEYPGVGVVEVFKDSARTKLVARGEAQIASSIDWCCGVGDATVRLAEANKSGVTGVVYVAPAAVSDVDSGNYLDFSSRQILAFPHTNSSAAYFVGIMPACYAKERIAAHLTWFTLGDDTAPVSWYCDFEKIGDDNRGVGTAFFREVDSPAISEIRTPGKPVISALEVSIDAMHLVPEDSFRVRLRREPAIDQIQKPLYVLGLELNNKAAGPKNGYAGWPQ